MQVFVCMYIYMCMNICMYQKKYIYIYIDRCVCGCVWVCLCLFVCLCVVMDLFPLTDFVLEFLLARDARLMSWWDTVQLPVERCTSHPAERRCFMCSVVDQRCSPWASPFLENRAACSTAETDNLRQLRQRVLGISSPLLSAHFPERQRRIGVLLSRCARRCLLMVFTFADPQTFSTSQRVAVLMNAPRNI